MTVVMAATIIAVVRGVVVVVAATIVVNVVTRITAWVVTRAVAAASALSASIIFFYPCWAKWTSTTRDSLAKQFTQMRYVKLFDNFIVITALSRSDFWGGR
jgi:hypothetical protein